MGNSKDAAAKFALQAFGPIYSRITNPTCDALEKKIAALEGGTAAVAVSSGHAAQLLCFSNLLEPGDHFVSTNKLYGGSVTQFGRQFAQLGWQVTFKDIDDYAGIEAAITPKTKAVYCEAIANPGGQFLDLFTFGLKGGYDAGKVLVDEVQMISLVANLGDARTLVAHPASMMHAQLTEEQRKAAGAETETIRLAVGIEDAKDIIADLRQALDKAP